MDISDLTDLLCNTSIDDTSLVEQHVLILVANLNETGQLGLNSMIYATNTLNYDIIIKICNEVKTLFPDITIKLAEGNILLDWS
jgi:hypothetical protein